MRGSGTAVDFLLRQALRQCGCGVPSPQKILHKRSAEAFLRAGFLHTHFNTVSRDEWQGAAVKAAFYISKHFYNLYFQVRLPVGVLTFYFFLSIICLSIETTSRIKNVFTINPEINFLILYGDI